MPFLLSSGRDALVSLLLLTLSTRCGALFSLQPRGGSSRNSIHENPLLRQQLPSLSEELLSKAQTDAFAMDGFIVVRGLFDSDEIQQMTDAGNRLVDRSQQGQFDTFSVVEKNLIYGLVGDPNRQQNDNNDDEEQQEVQTIVQTFRDVSLRSKVARICAQLMALDPSTQCLRLLRDVFLAKYVSTGPTCDWHVDDQGFWPESFLTGAQEDESLNDQPEGINVWIALDDFEPKYGGAMIVSKGSHKAPWRHEAHLAIGQNRRTDGGKTVQELVETFTDPDFNGTCALDMSSSELRAKAEASRVDIPLKKGDCIIATRSLFHRTARVTEEGVAHYNQTGQHLLHRYSLRYVVGTARLPEGEVADASAKYDPSLAGKTLDEICTPDSQPAWYPKVWPQVDRDIEERLDHLAQNEFPKALRKMAEKRAVIGALISEAREKKGLDDSKLFKKS